MSRLKKNLGYQTLLQIINTCLPLITAPYLSRVLGPSKLGVFSYTQSVVNYFVLIAMLGVVSYGTRSIASCGDDKESRSSCFWNIYALQFTVSLISVLMYITYIYVCNIENLNIAIIQGLYIVAALFDISWLFFGAEIFVITVNTSMVIRILSVICILFFVRSPNDLDAYTLIMSGGLVTSNILLWFYAKKIICFSKIDDIKINLIISHIKPNLVLFVPLLAMSVYHIMDKTMLGLFSSYEQTGYYYNADKIINIPMGIITGIGTVMLPRITSVLKYESQEKANELFLKTVELVTIISIAMAFGIAGISNNFIPFFFGNGYEECIFITILMVPVLIIKGFSYTARMQYLIPNNKERIFIESVILGAIINLFVNITLIPQLGAIGAAIGTVSAEFFACYWQYYCMSKYLNVLSPMVRSLGYCFIAAVMYHLVNFTGKCVDSNIVGILIQIMVGVISYSVLCLGLLKITKNPLLNMLKHN